MNKNSFIFHLFLVLILNFQIEVLMAAQILTTEPPSVGYFPRSFPRDPINVNIYLEHLLLGQVIEPLVESGPDGSIVPAVASSWIVRKEGREIEFTIQEGIKFSNGKPVCAKDIKFTLERHAQSIGSQSKPFLKRIVAINILSDNKFILKLDKPYVAIFKALSRDQLGILPEGWTFDANSIEPFIGTGAYKAIKTSSGWELIKNDFYRDRENVRIPKWKVLMVPAKEQWSQYETPDFVPFATEDLIENIKKTKHADNLIPYSEPVIHFFQSSIWCYPHGKTCNNEARKQLGAKSLADLVRRCIKKSGLKPATGIIPQGISGYLTETPVVNYKLDDSITDRHFSIAALPRDFEVLNSNEDIAAVQKLYNIKINLTKIEPTMLFQLPQKKPDFIVLSYAGGFYDPEGFLVVIPSAMSSELSIILGDSFPLYNEASQVMDWDKRNEYYKKLNKELIESHIVIPGWKHEAVRFRNPKIQIEEASLRYIARLKDYHLISK